MAKDYDPTLGLFSFQEYQGSPREENIDGEPRVFRTFFGESANRWTFINSIFGAVAAIEPVGEDPCVVICSQPIYYPVDNFLCERPGTPPVQFVQGPQYVMEPYSYRIQAWDDERAVSGGTQLGVNPDLDCGVLVEIEYRKTLVWWPYHLHDPSYTSEMNEAVDPLYGPDVPFIQQPTSVDYREELALELRTLKGRTMEITSYGSGGGAITPAAAAGKAINQITSDDIEPATGVNIHTFVVSLRTVPFVDLSLVRSIIGKVNNDVWFGYPAHAVLCSEVQPRFRYHPSNQIYYDIDFTFVAKWVPANGESPGDLMPPASANNGQFVHNDMVGIWNRAWWEYPIDPVFESQHWWPIIETGESDPTLPMVYDADWMLFKEVNFHEAFAWWTKICPPVGA
jgi:hypothetical protein